MRKLILRPFNTFVDQQDGDVLALELNECGKYFPAKCKNVARIMNELNFMASGDPVPYRVEPFEGYPWESKRPMRSGFIVYDERDPRVAAIGRINSRLSKYRSIPLVSLTEGRPDVHWHSSDVQVGPMVRRIINLVQRGLLQRVRECKHCKKWFYANRINKMVCTPACSKLYWQSSPEGRESRRIKMRDYMRKVRKREKELLSKGVRRGNL